MPKFSFEFLVRQRPVSHQTKSRANLQRWKAFVALEAARTWPSGGPWLTGDLRFTLVYLANDSPADIDNIIKPIQDALVGMVYEDDALISDVDSHRRLLSEPIDVTDLPPLLRSGVAEGAECVYVRVTDAADLKDYL